MLPCVCIPGGIASLCVYTRRYSLPGGYVLPGYASLVGMYHPGMPPCVCVTVGMLPVCVTVGYASLCVRDHAGHRGLPGMRERESCWEESLPSMLGERESCWEESLPVMLGGGNPVGKRASGSCWERGILLGREPPGHAGRRRDTVHSLPVPRAAILYHGIWASLAPWVHLASSMLVWSAVQHRRANGDSP